MRPITARDTVTETIRNAYPLTHEIQVLSNVASYELLFGPMAPAADYEGTGVDYLGFDSAVDTIRKWIDSQNITTSYIDIDCGCMVDEPIADADDELMWENVWEVSRRDIIEALFGKNLTEYL